MSGDQLTQEHPQFASGWEEREALLLAPHAMFAKNSIGRTFPEPLHPYRSPFQRDRDRILHSAAFRRLSGKMQVFTGDMGDYHRTRLTHTHEVATVARTIGRVLRLNEDLIEALALLHDIGHPPYGHSGEEALAHCLGENGGFSHNEFALVLVQQLETRYTTFPGLNLSREVLAGQDFRITHQHASPLLEVQIVDLADSIAYNAHDVDDALALGLLRFEQLTELSLVRRALAWGQADPSGLSAEARRRYLVHSLIDVQVADLLETSSRRLAVLEAEDILDNTTVRDPDVGLGLSSVVASEKEELSQFLFDNVYRHEQLIAVREQAAIRVRRLYEKLISKTQLLPERFLESAYEVGIERATAHYIAGMTDRFCDSRFHCLVELGATDVRDW